MCGADLEEDCASFLWHYFCRAGVWVQGWWEEVRASHIKRTLFIRRDLGTGNRNYLYLDAMLFFFSFFFFNPIPNCVWLDFLVWFPLGTKVLPKQCPPWKSKNASVSQNWCIPFKPSKLFLAMKPPLLSSVAMNCQPTTDNQLAPPVSNRQTSKLSTSPPSIKQPKLAAGCHLQTTGYCPRDNPYC